MTGASTGSLSVWRLLCPLARVHDFLTRLTFWVAMAAVAYLTGVLAWEVMARYALRQPSGWAPDTAALAFGLATFLAAPTLSKEGGHADMRLVVDALPASAAAWLRRFTLLLACAVCWLAAWFGYNELLRVYQRGVMVIAVTPIPKWWLMSAIVYSLISMGLYFLRHFLVSFRDAAASAGRGGEFS